MPGLITTPEMEMKRGINVTRYTPRIFVPANPSHHPDLSHRHLTSFFTLDPSNPSSTAEVTTCTIRTRSFLPSRSPMVSRRPQHKDQLRRPPAPDPSFCHLSSLISDPQLVSELLASNHTRPVSSPNPVLHWPLHPTLSPLRRPALTPAFLPGRSHL